MNWLDPQFFPDWYYSFNRKYRDNIGRFAIYDLELTDEALIIKKEQKPRVTIPVRGIRTIHKQSYDMAPLMRIVENSGNVHNLMPHSGDERLLDEKVDHLIANIMALQKAALSRPPFKIDFDQKKRLFGMIKARKRVNLAEAAQALRLEAKEIEYLIYDLIGDEKIDGEFNGQDFMIKSDINAFIDALDSSFKEWENKMTSGEGKV